ncbi:MAG: hypothetical protein ACE5HO_09675 [bacterium]
MTKEEMLQQLEELAERLPLRVRFEKGDFKGGLYRYKDDEEILINKDLSTEQKINIMAKELKTKLDVEGLYLLPALREVIESAGSLG